MRFDRVPRRGPDVIWQFMEDGVVLVLPEEGELRVLNEVGTTIWQLIDGQRTLQHIADELVSKYEVSPGEARKDLRAFIDQLEAGQLIYWESDPANGS